MKILLILPAADHLRIRNNTMEVPKRPMLRFSILPLTLVAALTPNEHKVEICDENVAPLDFACDADLVGISFMTALAPRAYEIAREFRRRGKIVVAGGYHPTLMIEDTWQNFDAAVVGDAEILWPQLLKAFRLNLTYRYDIIHENIRGCNPLQVNKEFTAKFSRRPIQRLIANFV